MSTMVFVKIKENDNVIDENTVVVVMFFQRSIYKTLYIWKGIYIIYETDIRTFYSLLIDENKTVSIIGIYYKLEKEVRYIDNCEVFLSSNRIDNLLLQRQRVVV